MAHMHSDEERRANQRALWITLGIAAFLLLCVLAFFIVVKHWGTRAMEPRATVYMRPSSSNIKTITTTAPSVPLG